ncbi:low molecular weight protein-tyrosine-phosphatase [Duganella callida]|uniref:Low molecular weight phosphotyrosine protein phosphatase n=1 Tax=Duganella callida TaxID=2561932 RepID=A0A4Y9SIV1_9BURK|nr:low molecular weight protein-tyrosine-phosphatase [Duganella callida]TFW25572.1 low molecular weight phosphotyrosine protein phosphatase [Duganella callida]
MTRQVSVLFVCMGNICRSPTAEGVFRHRVEAAGLKDRFVIDSAGTHGYHVGEPPDARSMEYALKRGYDLSAQRSRKVKASDFAAFDHVVAMDHDNLKLLQAICPPEHQHKLSLMMSHAARRDSDVVPDPYYGGGKGFDLVLDYLESAAEGLLRKLTQQAK